MSLRDIRLAHEKSGIRYPRPHLTCPGCNGIVVLCWGESRKEHIRHKSIDPVKPCRVDLTHSIAQDMLSDYLNVKGIVNVTSKCYYCSKVDNSVVPLEGNTYCKEVSYLSSRLDIAGISQDDKIVYCIEIRNKHVTTNVHDRDSIQWIEVQAHDVISNLKDGNAKSITLNDIRRHTCDACKFKDEEWYREKAFKLGFVTIQDSLLDVTYRVLDMAIRGNYIPECRWNSVGLKDDQIPLEIYWGYRNELVANGRCLRCHKTTEIKTWKLFCVNCYTSIKNTEKVAEWIPIAYTHKLKLRARLSWLDQARDVDRLVTCGLCNGSKDPSNKFSSTIWWFGKDKNVCIFCLCDRLIQDGLISANGKILFDV